MPKITFWFTGFRVTTNGARLELTEATYRKADLEQDIDAGERQP